MPETLLKKVVIQAVNEACADHKTYLPMLKANIEKVLDRDTGIADIDARISDLQTELLKRVNAKLDYENLGREINSLREEKYRIQLQEANRQSVLQKVADMEAYMDEIGGEVTEYDENLVRRLIDRITVHDEHSTVEFKSGIEIEVLK